MSAFLNQLFVKAAGLKHTGPTSEHPLILLNSIKNIIGDDRINPSIKLLKAAEDRIQKLPRRQKDDSILNKVAKEGIGQTIFIMDLEDVCQSGDIERMESEAARLHWASENSAAGLECLAEVALQDIGKNGPFAYHLQRAYVFQDNKEASWTFTRSLLVELVKAPLPEPHIETDKNPLLYLNVVLKSPDPALWIKYAAALRLWEGEYIRSRGYKREISHWLARLNKTLGILNSEIETGPLESYLQVGGPHFIHLAEDMLKEKSADQKIIALEALRHLSKKGTGRTLTLAARAIKFLTES